MPKSKGKYTPNSKGKGKRVYDKGPKKGPKDGKPVVEEKGNEYNSPEWRKAISPVGEQVYAFSFSNFLGVPTPLTFMGVTTRFNVDPIQTVPSIATLNVNPAPGDTGVGATAMYAAVNQQGLRTFTALSAGNAKTTSYAPQDVTTAVLAVGEVISMFEHARRALGVAGTYNPRNRNYPKDAITAMGFKADDLISGLANYRIQFNLMALQASKIPFPANIRYFDLCRVLYQNIFVDQPNDLMAQTYMFKPYTTWILDEITNPNGTQLTTYNPYSLDTSPGTQGEVRFSTFLDAIQHMLDALMSSATLNYVYSDVLRLAEKNNVPMYAIAQIPEDYIVMPVYSEEALIQIENSYILGAPDATGFSGGSGTASNDVVHDANYNAINYHPMFISAAPGISGPRIINFDKADVPLDDRISASRFLATHVTDTYDTTNSNFWHAAKMTDHYIVSVDYWHTNSSDVFTKVTTDSTSYVPSSVQAAEIRAQIIGKFAHHPKYLTFTESGSGSNKKFEYRGLWGDLGYWTTLDYKAVKAMQDAAFFEIYELK